MDCVLPTLPKKTTQKDKDLYFDVKYAWMKLSIYYSGVTSMMGMLTISVIQLWID
jgi:hypothetical protein